jgi:hypothetical protein
MTKLWYVVVDTSLSIPGIRRGRVVSAHRDIHSAEKAASKLTRVEIYVLDKRYRPGDWLFA